MVNNITNNLLTQTNDTSALTQLTDKQIGYLKELGVENVTPFILSKNQGLIEFIETNAIHKKMAQQGHKLEVNDQKNVCLLFHGELTPWAEIKEKIDNGEISVDVKGKLIGTYYTYQGLVVAPDLSKFDIDGADLEKLMKEAVVVFQKGDPRDWNHEFVLSIVSQSHPFGPEQFKEHSWFHFKHPDGQILSIGLYRTRYGLEAQPGRIELVDDYESYKAEGGTRDECDIRIGKGQWEKYLKHYLNLAKKGPIPYHQIHGTCATEITKTFNAITKSTFFDSSIHLIELAPKKYKEKIDLLPQSVLDLIGSFAVRGAGRAIDINTLAENERQQARLPKEMTDEQKRELQSALNQVAKEFANKSASEQSRLDHPYQLRRVGLEIASYRQDKIENLQKLYAATEKRILSDQSLSAEQKNRLLECHKENFEETRDFMKLDLPPRSWNLKKELPSSHPDYSTYTYTE